MAMLPVELFSPWIENDPNKESAACKKGGSLSGRKTQSLHDQYGKAIGGTSELSAAFQNTETGLVQHIATAAKLETRLADATQLYQQQQPLATQRYDNFDRSLKGDIGERALQRFHDSMGDLFQAPKVSLPQTSPLTQTTAAIAHTAIHTTRAGQSVAQPKGRPAEVTLKFPSESALLHCLNNHPLLKTTAHHDDVKPIIEAAAEIFANQDKVPGGVNLEALLIISDVNEKLQLPGQRQAIITISLIDALKDCATQK